LHANYFSTQNEKALELTTFNSEGWRTPPEKPELNPGEIHIWRINLNEMLPQLKLLSGFLDLTEKRRAARFHFQHDQEHFAVGRGMLRLLLSFYLPFVPREIDFEYNQYGKPALKKIFHSEIQFNVSHSHGLALVAVSAKDPLGIDLEWMRPELAGLKIARRFFAPAEVAALEQLPEAHQKEGFFNCWTRKEAFIKAKGKGLSIPLNQFAVALEPNQPAALLSTGWDASEAGRWSLYALPIDDGFRAALAAENRGHSLFYWTGSEANFAGK
jgi:4'-phosphopantetheinyl transferase